MYKILIFIMNVVNVGDYITTINLFIGNNNHWRREKLCVLLYGLEIEFRKIIS